MHSMDKQKSAIILAILGILGAVAGGSYAIDFSNTQTTNTDNSQTTTIIEGDTTIINEAVDTFTDELFDDFVDRGYDFYCEEVEPDSPECDAYWGEP